MRIGMMTGEYPPMEGGVGAFSRVLARTLVDEGHEVFILTSRLAQPSDDAVTVENRIGAWGLFSPLQIAPWARRHRLDVINLQYQTAAYAMSPWIHFAPDLVRAAPFVTTFHDLRFPYLFPKAGPLRPWIVRHLVRASAGVIVTNQEDFAHVGMARRAVLVPIGSNVDVPLPPGFEVEQWRSQAGAQPGDFLIAYFGFLNHSKGVDTLIDALERLRHQGIPARLIMIGGRTGASDATNATYAQEIEARIAGMGLDFCIHWTGFVDDAAVAAYLTAADAVALPFTDGASYRRGSLMAAIEGGCAIVTTRPTVPVPAFEDGGNMLLVPPSDDAALARALQRLADDTTLRQQIRDGAKRLAVKFDWRSIARETVAFFKQVSA